MSDRCTAKLTGYRGGNCGGPVHFWTDPLGALLSSCEWCARKAAQLCLQCPRKTSSTRARFCATCIKARRLERKRKTPLTPEQKRRKNRRRRERYRNDPAYRQACIDAHQRWRELHPGKHRDNMRRLYRVQGPERDTMLARKRLEYQRRKARKLEQAA